MPGIQKKPIGKTAILMLSRNTLEFTKLTLLSLKVHEPKIPYEIRVLDQGSTDGSLEWMQSMEEKWENFKVIPIKRNLLFSKGNNVIRYFISDDVKYLLLLNTDVHIQEDGWLEERIKPLDVEPTVGVVGTFGNCHNVNKAGNYFYADLAKTRVITEEFFKQKCCLPDGLIRDVTGWSLATSVELWDKLGGLNVTEKYKHMWSDTEYSCRVQLLGYEAVMQPYNDKMIHMSGVSHDAEKLPEKYKRRVEKIKPLLEKYEKEISN